MSASTQTQALSALLFLYREVLRQDLDPIDAMRAHKPRRLPTVLTRDETRRVIGGLKGVHQSMAKLLYGSGLRLITFSPRSDCPLTRATGACIVITSTPAVCKKLSAPPRAWPGS